MRGSYHAPTPYRTTIGAATVGTSRAEFVPKSCGSVGRCTSPRVLFGSVKSRRDSPCTSASSVFSGFDFLLVFSAPSSACSAVVRKNQFPLKSTQATLRIGPAPVPPLPQSPQVLAFSRFSPRRSQRLSGSASKSHFRTKLHLLDGDSFSRPAPPRRNTRFPWFRLVRVTQEFAPQACASSGGTA